MVLYYYAFCVLLLLVFRPVISMKLCEGQGSRCTYAALYFLPITAMIHSTCAGLLCKIWFWFIASHLTSAYKKDMHSISTVLFIDYSYPYLLLIGSVLSTAILLAMKKIAVSNPVYFIPKNFKECLLYGPRSKQPSSIKSKSGKKYCI